VSYSSIIMMGISRILLDVVAPASSSTKGIDAAANAASSHI
jgi:hypothetical protein